MMEGCNCGWVSLALAGVAAFVLYSWLVRKYEYWGRRGVRFVQPTFLLGNMGPVIFQKTSMAENCQKFYHTIKSNKFGGFYEFLNPVFMPADPDLIREIFVKSFDHFADRRIFTNEKTDPLFSRALPSLKGDEWREMRNKLSPAFTTSKLRGMFPLISRCGEQFSHFLVTRPDADTEPLEFKSTFTRLTNDVVATVAFGVECNAVKNPEERFYKLGQRLMDFGGARFLVSFGHIIVPKVMEFFSIPFMPKESTDFFQNSIKGTMQHREKEGVTRPDMLQLLMAAQKGGIESAHGDEQDAGTVGEAEDAAAMHRKHLAPQDQDKSLISKDDIAAQAFIFFLAGFDTVATVMSFLAHELAVNTDMQERLREEIDAAILENDDQLTYDAILKMKYLDMLISESMRKYPPAGFTDRRCTKNFTIPGTNVVIEKDTLLLLPIFPLHRDPEHFPDPERFDPERFNDENKKNIKPYTYLPFGSGPHNCIGMRFALLEVKLCMAHVLATCELRVSAKTEVPLQLSRKSFQMGTDAGFWLTCVPRTNPTIKLDLGM